MNYFTGALIPDADAELTTDFIPTAERTAVWINFFPTNVSFHLTREQITKLRDDLSQFLERKS